MSGSPGSLAGAALTVGLLGLAVGVTNKVVKGTQKRIKQSSPRSGHRLQKAGIFSLLLTFCFILLSSGVSAFNQTDYLAQNLVAYYNFNDTTELVDGVFNMTDNEGTGVFTETDALIGKTGNLTDNNNWKVLTPTYIHRFNATDRSFNLWIRHPFDFQVEPNEHSMISKTEVGDQWRLFMNGNPQGNILFNDRITAASNANWNGNLNLCLQNTWCMISVVRNTTNVIVYINGIEEEVAPIWFWDENVSNSFYIGTWFSDFGGQSLYDWNGQIDELSFYEKALNTSDIAELYNSGNGVTYQPTGPLVETGCQNITSDFDMTEDVVLNETNGINCFYLSSPSLTFDCQGYSIYSNASGQTFFTITENDVTIKNCDMRQLKNNYSQGIISTRRFNLVNTTIFFNSSVGNNYLMSVNEWDGSISIYNSTLYSSQYGISAGQTGGLDKFIDVYDSNITIGIQWVSISDSEYKQSKFYRSTMTGLFDYSIGWTFNDGRYFLDIRDSYFRLQRVIKSNFHQQSTLLIPFYNTVFDASDFDTDYYILSLGGLFTPLNNLEMENVTFIKNNSVGGFFAIQAGSTMTLRNITLQNNKGEINFGYVYDNSGGLTLANFDVMNISDNKAFIDTTTYPAWNVSSIVTLSYPQFTSSNFPYVNFGDGNYVPCLTCVIYDSGTPFIFGVPHWTDYISNNTGPTITSPPSVILIIPVGVGDVSLQFIGIEPENETLDTWIITDTGNFTINQSGFVTNLLTLPVGSYPFIVGLNDSNGNTGYAGYVLVVQNPPVTPMEKICGDSSATFIEASAIAGILMVIVLIGAVLVVLIGSVKGTFNLGVISEYITLEKLPSMIIMIALTYLVLATMAFIFLNNICPVYGG